MQSISPLTTAALLDPVQKVLHKFEVYDGAAWVNVSGWLKDVSVDVAGPGPTPKPLAGSWHATLDNEDGRFHPFNPAGGSAGLLRIGRQVRISFGGHFDGVDYYWQRLIGYMNAPRFDHGARTVTLSGHDYAKRLVDTCLYTPNNYWGDIETFSSVASFTETGAQLYDKGDALDPVAEANSLDPAWEVQDINSIWEIVHAGGGVYYGKYYEEDGGSGSVKHPAIAGIAKDSRYIFKVRYRTPLGENFTFELAQTIGGNRQVISSWAAQSTSGFVTEVRNFKAAGSANLEFKIIGSSLGIYYMEIDWVSLKAGLTNWNDYQMPSTCNGPHYATLDGEVVSYGDPAAKDGTGGGYFYDEGTRNFYFDEEKTVEAGTNNLLVYFYETRTVENVVADLLVRAGLYADQAAALAAMDYTATGVSIPRVWFDSGSSALECIGLLCERVNYRFWFSHGGTPTFKPAPKVGSIALTLDSWGRQSALSDYQDLDQIRNRVVVEGAERAMFRARDDKDRSRYVGTASDATSIAAYLEHTESIKNNLFQDDTSAAAMAATVLADRKTPLWFARLSSALMVAPLEIGDTIKWPLKMRIP